MDPVKMKFALAVCLSLGLAGVTPALAQSSNTSIALSVLVDGVRDQCGLGLLAPTTGSQTCQSFKDYGARMQCVANDLADEVRAKGSPVLSEVSHCYRALGDALVAGRGANNDQVNALEDVCRNLRRETIVPRSPIARDAAIFASDILMPSFSRRTVAVPTINPLMGIRLHDLPDCSVALMVPPGPPSTAGTSGPNRVARADNSAVTSAVQSPSFAYLTPQGGDSAVAAALPQQSSPGNVAEGQPSIVDIRTATSPQPALPPEARSATDKLAEGLVDRTVGKSKGRSSAADINASASISESAVINALPLVSASGRRPARRPVARVERSPAAGYGVPAVAEGRSKSRASALPSAVLESQSGARSSNPNGSSSGYSASSPPGLPLTGPPLRPQTAGAVR